MKNLTILVIIFIFIFGFTSCSTIKNDGGDALMGGFGDAFEAFENSDSSTSVISPSPERAPSVDGDYVADSSTDDYYGDDIATGEKEDAVDDGDTVTGADGTESVVLPSGMITACAWCDNDYYDMWLSLFTQGENGNGKFYQYSSGDIPWHFTTLNRIKVSVKSDDEKVAGAAVYAFDQNGSKVFEAITDANGIAYIFTDASSGTVSVEGDESSSVEFTVDNRDITIETSVVSGKLNIIDIMFVVDVTGSMGDEISFLKAELTDVITRIAANNTDTVINLALLFYRDDGDKVPFDYYDFSDVTNPDALAAQQSALNSQSASGGGDYPEAVDEALELAVGKQWSTGSTTKIVFQILDAPPHSANEDIEAFKSAVNTAAEKGIRICPIICSGALELTEYLMRQVAIITGGTFVYVTDDSGIGNAHHDPELPNVTVELLNSLIVRLVNGYHTGEFADPIFWKQDPALAQ